MHPTDVFVDRFRHDHVKLSVRDSQLSLIQHAYNREMTELICQTVINEEDGGAGDPLRMTTKLKEGKAVRACTEWWFYRKCVSLSVSTNVADAFLLIIIFVGL